MRFSPLALFVAAACVSAPAAAASPALETRLKEAGRIEIVQAYPNDPQTVRGVMLQHRNGDGLLSVAMGAAELKPLLVTLCAQAAYFNPDAAGTTAGKPLTPEQTQMSAYGRYMAVMGGAAMVQDVLGPNVELPQSGATQTLQREKSWAYGKEQYEVTVSQGADGTLRIDSVKTGITTTTPDAEPDASFSTDDDKAAQRADLEPVGTKRELVLSGQQEAAMAGSFPLKGWVPARGEAVGSVDQARKAAGCGK